jgi:hypothetical protein
VFLVGGLVGAGSGFGLGLFLFTDYYPPWKVQSLGNAPDQATDVVATISGSFTTDASRDIVFVSTASGDIHSLFQGYWERLPSFPVGIGVPAYQTSFDGRNEFLSAVTDQGASFQLIDDQWATVPAELTPLRRIDKPLCAEWRGQIGTPDVLGSSGYRFERPISTMVKCHVLLTDGTLQVWSRATDAYTLLLFLVFTTGLGASVGVFTSLRLARRIIWKRQSRPSSA